MYIDFIEHATFFNRCFLSGTRPQDHRHNVSKRESLGSLERFTGIGCIDLIEHGIPFHWCFLSGAPLQCYRINVKSNFKLPNFSLALNVSILSNTAPLLLTTHPNAFAGLVDAPQGIGNASTLDFSSADLEIQGSGPLAVISQETQLSSQQKARRANSSSSSSSAPPAQEFVNSLPLRSRRAALNHSNQNPQQASKHNIRQDGPQLIGDDLENFPALSRGELEAQSRSYRALSTATPQRNASEVWALRHQLETAERASGLVLHQQHIHGPCPPRIFIIPLPATGSGGGARATLDGGGAPPRYTQ